MFKRVPVQKLTGQEAFRNSGGKKFTVLEFWQYGFSNLNSNVLRGALAEFIVENALKDVKGINIRNPWGDSDVDAPNGKTIEVKCCSYLQDWDQKEFSKVLWSGLKAKKLYWSSAVGAFPTSAPDYKSDIYVLALFKHQVPDTLDILDMDQWCFYVLPQAQLKEVSKNGSSITIQRLEKNNISSIGFSELADRIAKL